MNHEEDPIDQLRFINLKRINSLAEIWASKVTNLYKTSSLIDCLLDISSDGSSLEVMEQFLICIDDAGCEIVIRDKKSRVIIRGISDEV